MNTKEENIKKRRLSAYGLITSGDNVLLSLLNRGPNKGKWNLPGGGVEFGEDPKEAFKRELREEADIELVDEFRLGSVISELHKWKNCENGQEELHLIGIIYQVVFSTLVPCKETGDGDSSDGCKWFFIEDVNNSIATSMVLKALKLIK